jgi:hypothetical protein
VRSDGTLGQYSLGGAGVKRRLLALEGAHPGELEELAHEGVRLVGSDTTHVFCLPSCRHARRTSERHRVEFHSAREAQERGYRACKVCKP